MRFCKSVGKTLSVREKGSIKMKYSTNQSFINAVCGEKEETQGTIKVLRTDVLETEYAPFPISNLRAHIVRENDTTIEVEFNKELPSLMGFNKVFGMAKSDFNRFFEKSKA